MIATGLNSLQQLMTAFQELHLSVLESVNHTQPHSDSLAATPPSSIFITGSETPDLLNSKVSEMNIVTMKVTMLCRK